jgi:prepilin-type N-terminal cleavage/methylation domain-containing protein
MSFPLVPRGRYAFKAFTLIELLTVIAIIGILAGITLAVTRGVGDKARKARTQAELAVLASAMEEYKRFFGSYLYLNNSETAKEDTNIDPTPEVAEGDSPYNPTSDDRAFNFFRALNGRIGPELEVVERQISKTTRVEKYGRSFVSPANFSLERKSDTEPPSPLKPLPEPNITNSAKDPDFANAFLDPWGNRYIYFYKEMGHQAAWKREGFILLSAGPDGKVKFNTLSNRRAGDPIDVAPDTAGASDPRRVNDDNIYYSP